MSNPFPGLRPFRIEESHLFFGRENQVSEVLSKLKSNKFVSIVGNSGIGKSSFVNCGILPSLQKTASNEAAWQIVNFRPGANPLDRLTKAMHKALGKHDALQASLANASRITSPESFAQLCYEYKRATGEQVLLYVDQFEEIFRFNESNKDEEREIAQFINIIIQSIRTEDLPVSVIITMRSDFVGDCSRYPEFTKAINDSQFLIPQMTREEKRSAIVGPVEAMDAKIDEDLVNVILESIGERHDQLPLMQHSLMRTWDHWQSTKLGNEPISSTAYDAIGGMDRALSVHANEIFNALDNNKKKICERLFKSITEKGAEGRSVRRPTSIREIGAIANASVEDVKSIVEHFRKPGRTLLTPSSEVPLTDETVIDISHESLMRIWEVLTQWLEEEHEAIKEYLHIAEAAEMHQTGKGGLMKSPELQMALNWQQENAPTKKWGIRHHNAYDRTMQFLGFSEKKFLQEQRLKEKLQKLRLAVFKTIAVVFGLGAIVALAFFFYAQQQRKEAQKQQIMADQQKELAKEQAEKAEKSANEAMTQKQIAQLETHKALKSQRIANEQKKEAMEQRELAEKERMFAMEQKDKATEAQQKAMKEETKALKLRMLSIAKSMAVKSLQESDNIIKSLVARQAYNLYINNGGSETDPDIYNSLYYALKNISNESFNTAKAHLDNVRAISTLKHNKNMYSAGSDGRIYRWIQSGHEFMPELISHEKGKVHKAMDVSPDGRFLVAGGDYSHLKLVNLSKGNTVREINVPVPEVQYLSFSKDNKKVIFLGSNKQIMEWDFVHTREITKSNLKINSLDLHPQGQFLAIGKAAGKIEIYDFSKSDQVPFYQSQTKADITSVKFSDSGNLLAVGDMHGMVRLIDAKTGNVLYKLPGHTAMVNQIAFSHSGTQLATASFDHSVRIWSLKNPYQQPILLNDHNDWVWSVAFSHNDEYLLAGCRDKLIRTWLLNIDQMAGMICESDVINRNFSREEWENYVAEDINYECTCKENPPAKATEKKREKQHVGVVLDIH